MLRAIALPRQQQGLALILFMLVLVLGAAAVFATALSNRASQIERERRVQKTLSDAKDALIAYATTARALNVTATTGPGYMPCPDLDDDGLSESPTACGNTFGSDGANQYKRLGRLPWKTLGLPDPRDDAGERLWYAVSSVYKTDAFLPGLNPDTGMGTITIRDPAGNVVHDGTKDGGTLANLYNAQGGGVAAVIFAPGAAMERWEDAAGATRTQQNRTCSGGTCDATEKCTTSPPTSTPKCNPINYLEKAPGLPGNEDNADFVDRNDSRSGNTNGFIQGPVINASGAQLVNDRLVVITYNDIMQAMMGRVAAEAYHCLLEYGTAPGNLNRYPWPAPACRSGYTNSLQWSDRNDILFGRFPRPPFDTSQPVIAGSPPSSNGWAPGTPSACSIASYDVPSNTGAFSPWFEFWKFHVFYALAYAYQPASGMPTCGSLPASNYNCLRLVDGSGNVVAANKQFAVFVAGPPLNGSPAQDHSGTGMPAKARFPQNYLERTNPNLEAMNTISGATDCDDIAPSHPALCTPMPSCLTGSGANRVTVTPRDSTFNDVVRYFPN